MKGDWREKRKIFNNNVQITIEKLLSECKSIRDWRFQSQFIKRKKSTSNAGKDILSFYATVPGCKEPQEIEIVIKTKLKHKLFDIKLFDDWFNRLGKVSHEEISKEPK